MNLAAPGVACRSTSPSPLLDHPGLRRSARSTELAREQSSASAAGASVGAAPPDHGTKGPGMPSGKDITGGGSGGGGGKRTAAAAATGGRPAAPRRTPTAPSAARATATSARWSKGPGDVYICGECIELCQSILDQERRRRGRAQDALHRHPDPARDQGAARRVRHRPGPRQEGPLGRRPQPLQAAGPRRGHRQRRSRSTSRTSC